MYRLYYQRETAKDVLYIIYEPSAYPDKVEQKGNVVALYNQGKLIGINILDFSKIVKIRANGMIPVPEDALIDVINLELSHALLEPLPYARESGYIVARVNKVEEHPLDEKKRILSLSAKNKTFETVTRYQNLQEGSLCVVAIDGCLRYDGTLFQKRIERNIPIDCEICSESDLRIGDKSLEAFIPNKSKEGDDFFL